MLSYADVAINPFVQTSTTGYNLFITLEKTVPIKENQKGTYY